MKFGLLLRKEIMKPYYFVIVQNTKIPDTHIAAKN